MLRSGGIARIPVRKAWRVWGMEPLNIKLNEDNIRCGLLWETESGLISSVSLNPATFDKETSELIVQASGNSSGSGNAVVALYQGNKIIWSWHIWVTDYEPDGSGKTFTYGDNEFMDRNFGAVSADILDRSKTFGLMYQWGRKDPFPPINLDEKPAVKTPYQFLGSYEPVYPNSIDFAIKSTGTVMKDNLALSLNEPMTFITSKWDWCNPTSVKDFTNRWTIEEKGENEYEIDHYKFEYDPCPDGWKTATPKRGYESPWYRVQNDFGGIIMTDGFYIRGDDNIPATGYMNCTDATYIDCWYSFELMAGQFRHDAYYGTRGYGLKFDAHASGVGGRFSYGYFYSAIAGPLRCVKDLYFHPQYD